MVIHLESGFLRRRSDIVRQAQAQRQMEPARWPCQKRRDALQAAMRELAEETGLTFDQLSYVSEYKDDKVIHSSSKGQCNIYRSTRRSGG